MSEYELLHGGDGPPLLLLHSGTLTFREWRAPFKRLSKSFEVLAPTLPGSLGGPPLDCRDRSVVPAMADYVEQLMDEHGFSEPLPIAGSSLGGVLSLELAVRGRASQVIAFAPPWAGVKSAAAYVPLFAGGGALLRVIEPLIPFLVRSPAAAASVLVGSPAPTVLDAADTEATLRSFASFPWWQIGVQRRGSLAGLLPALDQVDVPVTLVWGTADRLVPFAVSKMWQRRLPQSELIVLPGLPHVPHLRDPDGVAELIEQAVDRTLKTTEGAIA
jgi:pimeloyl-ACP methyl ester carboxylesterase